MTEITRYFVDTARAVCPLSMAIRPAEYFCTFKEVVIGCKWGAPQDRDVPDAHVYAISGSRSFQAMSSADRHIC